MTTNPPRTALEQLLADEIARRADAHQHLADYAQRVVGVTPAAHHRYICDELERGILNDEWDDCVICLPPGGAKALALDTPIPTPDGWTTMGALRVGDTVFDENGKPCDVTWVSPVWRNRPVYSVTTDCGDKIIADHDHEWLVRLCGKHPVFKIKETHQLHRKRSKRPMIARAAALDLSEAFLPIHPYLLGVWLGDGTSASMSITSSDEDRPWMRSELERLGYKTSDRSATMLFGVKGVRALFTHFGLLHDPAHNTHGRKHIPQQYLRGSYQQRLHLLQGLVDTDGTVCKTKGSTTFCNTNLELAVQVRELVRSLGVKVGWSESRAVLNGVDHGPVYRVSFYLKDSARLPRKARLTRDSTRTTDTYIDVVPAGRADTVCIEVDSPSHLFLCGRSMTPTHNSTYASHCLPAWFLGHFPDNNVILASHTATLAEKWSRRVRDTVASPDHTRVFEDSTLSKDSTSVSKWSTSLNGEFLAAGVGMSILGFRADLCLTENAQVRTKTGYTSISNIKSGDEVEGYDQQKFSTGYYRVVATKRRTADLIYRVHTTDGRVVEATGNHPFFTGGRFVPAMALAVGDVLLSSVWHPSDAQCAGNGQEDSQGGDDVLLLEGLCQHLQSATGGSQLQGLQHTVPSLWQYFGVLFESVRWKASSNRGLAMLRRLWEGISSSLQHGGIPVLFDVVQEPCTQSGNGGIQQPRMATWQRPEQVSGRQRVEVQGSQEIGNVDGQSGMRHLLQHGEPARSPCGHGLDQQRPDQRGDALPVVPHGSSWCRPGETFETTVARIEVVRGDTDVWDIQVEGVQNFFANGVLVHNCVLDDPISGWEQAQSATQLEKIHNWFKADLKSRLKPKAKIITICQRTAAYDMAGYMMKEHAENPTRRLRTIILPMLAGEDDPLGRAPGERLWPTWYTPEMVVDLQKDEFIWKTMWQQEPPSDSGSWVTTDDIQFRPSPLITPETPVYASSDLALSVNKGDYTVHFVVAVDHNGDWDIIEGKRGRVDSEQSSKDIITLAQTYSPREWLIDDDNASKVFMHLVATKARETSTPVQWKPMPMRGQDKETRAAALRGQFKRRKIFMPPDAPFTHWLTKELLVFPNAVGSGVDDGVDALALFGRRLSTISPMAVAAPKPVVKTIQDATLNELWEDHERKAYSRKRL